MGRSGVSLPHLLSHIDVALAMLRRGNAGLLLDFDGTLSEFTLLPDDAVIHPKIVESLSGLVRRLALTVVMSGRAASDVSERVGIEGIVYIGNHGAERIIDGALSVAPESAGGGDGMQELLDALRAVVDEPGMVWEDKRFSASIHYRMAADESRVVERLTAALDTLPQAAGLDVFRGNKLIEIRRRDGVNKGAALDKAIRDWDLSTVIFLGDDTTDADALRVLQRRKAAGAVRGLGVAVMQPGTPASVLDNADYRLDGVAEVAEFLDQFAQAAPRVRPSAAPPAPSQPRR